MKIKMFDNAQYNTSVLLSQVIKRMEDGIDLKGCEWFADALPSYRERLEDLKKAGL